MTIEQAIEKMIQLPKRATIVLWLHLKGISRGIRGSELRRFVGVELAKRRAKEYFATTNMTSTSATDTTCNLKLTDIRSAIKKLDKDLERLNLDGLAKDLGITKEGAMRLIWLFADVRNTKDGSGKYSKETISLVKNAVLEERILKLTTIPSGFQPLLTKKKLRPTSKHWKMHGYGIRKMDERSAVNVTVV